MVALAFLRRDFLIWSSYRLAVLWQVLATGVLISIVYFIGRSVGVQPGAEAGRPGGFVAFLLTGLAFTDVFYQMLNSPSQAIRENQRTGTLEPLLMTPITMSDLLLASPLFKFVLALVRMASLLAFGAVALGYWHEANALSAIAVFVPAAVAFVGLGTLSAAIVVLTKQGDPILIAYGAAMGLLGGALFPVEALPGWVQPLAVLVPLTHALTGMRAALDGAPPQEVIEQVLALSAMAGVLFPIGAWVFSRAVRRAKEEGSLAQY